MPDHKTIVLLELKNRVDSGGTAARREIWTKKFKAILDLFRIKALFEKDAQTYSLIDVLKEHGYEKVEIYIGILFNVDGTPATPEGDRSRGFFSSNKEGFQDLLNYIRKEKIPLVSKNEEDLNLTININGIDITFGALYGNQIPGKLFKKQYSISDLLFLRYDDIWLSQLTSIWERAFLLQYGTNFIKIFENIRLRDFEIRNLYNDFIEQEGDEKILVNLVNLLMAKYSSEFRVNLCPPQRDREEYLADIIQFLGAVEA